MPVVNRALSAPINIHCDHTDTMAERDSGWLQFYCESAEEVYHMIFIALKLAENEKVLLPAMVCQDGFITSHGVENLREIETKKIKSFIGTYNPKHSLLDIEHPISSGSIFFYDYFFEARRQQIDAIEQAKLLYPKVAKEFEKISGVYYDFVEEYNLKDAEYVIVAMSSTCGTVKDVVDFLRKQGKKVGLLKIRVFRPFPNEEIVKLLKDKKKVAILDRAIAPGSYAPLFSEIRSVFYESDKKPEIYSYMFGLGGRDVTLDNIESVFSDLINNKKEKINYLGLRE
jgi:pyruvate ferredoxin oxidoreductase alpha subunit